LSPIPLPTPDVKGNISVEEAIARRRSIRRYLPQPLTLAQLGQVLWACQGLTHGRFRACPSAGATYPLEVFALVGADGVEGLEAGVYHYEIKDRALSLTASGDRRTQVASASLDQRFLREAPVTIVVGAIYGRTTEYYGQRGERYIHFEVGHVGQDVHLQALALGLGTVMVGAFEDEEIAGILGLEKEVRPLYLMPVGFPR